MVWEAQSLSNLKFYDLTSSELVKSQVLRFDKLWACQISNSMVWQAQSLSIKSQILSQLREQRERERKQRAESREQRANLRARNLDEKETQTTWSALSFWPQGRATTAATVHSIHMQTLYKILSLLSFSLPLSNMTIASSFIEQFSKKSCD